MPPKIILGIFIILSGLSIIINHVFKINIPLGKFLVGLFIIYLGVKILLGGFGVNINVNGDKNAVFSKHDYAPNKLKTSNEYNAVFGSSVIDLSDTEIAENETVKIAIIKKGESIIKPNQVSFTSNNSLNENYKHLINL